jgi:hypothetical protein
MIGYRECDYREPPYRYSSRVHEMPVRCACGVTSVASCRGCGADVCADHAWRCEEPACFGSGAEFCEKCTTLVDDLRYCNRCVMDVPASEMEI